MNPTELKTIIEFGVMSILALSLSSIVYFSIDRFSAFKFISGQLSKFKNKTELEIELNKKMTIIYSVSSNAVYIGLLGTVLGIIVTLSQIGASDQAGIIASLSLPLISTAASLVVAIIGTFFYNALVARIETVGMLWDIEHGHAAEAKVKKRVPVKSEEIIEEVEQDGYEDEI